MPNNILVIDISDSKHVSFADLIGEADVVAKIVFA